MTEICIGEKQGVNLLNINISVTLYVIHMNFYVCVS